MTMQTRPFSSEELESAFRRELTEDRWAAVETAYALAVRFRDADDEPKAREWAVQCTQLLESFPSDTEQQVATARVLVGGVTLPSYLHAGVVKARFGELS